MLSSDNSSEGRGVGQQLPLTLAQHESSAASESRLWEGGYGYRAMIPVGSVAALVTVCIGGITIAMQGLSTGLFVMLVAGVVVLGGTGLYLAYRRLSIHYELTDQRFVHQSGLLRRVTNRIEVIDVDDVAFGQGPIERLLGVGTIKIISSDRSHPELLLPGIDNVKQVATQIDDARRAERHRRGLYIEQV